MQNDIYFIMYTSYPSEIKSMLHIVISSWVKSIYYQSIYQYYS